MFLAIFAVLAFASEGTSWDTCSARCDDAWLAKFKENSLASASITGGSHIVGIEFKTAFHLNNVGDYTAYEAPYRRFEVQVQTWPCNGDHVTCVCGVAVREEDDLVRINACGDAYYTTGVGSPEVDVVGELREHTNITRSADGHLVQVSFPSGSDVRVEGYNHAGGFLNVFITIPETDKYNGQGLIGSLDGNVTNDFTHRDGTFQALCSNCMPAEFTGSWKNNRTTSLFENPPPDTEGGLYTDADPTGTMAFDPDEYAHFQPARGTWPTPSAITETQAEATCRQALQGTQLWSSCQDQAENINNTIVNCKIDIMFGDNFDMLAAHVDSFTTVCQMELAKDPLNYVISPDGEYALQKELAAEVCGQVCEDHGHCERGRCVCDSGYTGATCQLLEGQGPQLKGEDIFCDINQRPCRLLYLEVTNIQLSDALACKILEILPDGNMSTTASILPAEFVHSGKLACHLPDARVKSDRSTKTYVISATTDGVLYGNTIIITVYDSVCQNCSQAGCLTLPDTCLIEDLCFQDGDVRPSDAGEKCIVSESTSHWIRIYPAITSSLSGPDTDDVITCRVITNSTRPEARYKVSWYIDDFPFPSERESNLSPGPQGATVKVADLPIAGMLTCKVRSFYWDRQLYSPYAVSNVIDIGNVTVMAEKVDTLKGFVYIEHHTITAHLLIAVKDDRCYVTVLGDSWRQMFEDQTRIFTEEISQGILDGSLVAEPMTADSLSTHYHDFKGAQECQGHEVFLVTYSPSAAALNPIRLDLYPAITSSLSGPGADDVMTCRVITNSTRPEARYKVSWYVDNLPFPNEGESNLSPGPQGATVKVADLPVEGMLTCKIRSFYSDRRVYSPYTVSNAIDLTMLDVLAESVDNVGGFAFVEHRTNNSHLLIAFNNATDNRTCHVILVDESFESLLQSELRTLTEDIRHVIEHNSEVFTIISVREMSTRYHDDKGAEECQGRTVFLLNYSPFTQQLVTVKVTTELGV